jgi:sodium transport system permease protein
MNLKKSFEVFKKELVDIFRDKKSVIMMVLIPIILYPIIFSVLGQIIDTNDTEIENYNSQIAIKGNIDEDLYYSLNENLYINILEISNYEENLDENYIDAYIEKKGNEILVYFDNNNAFSVLALDRMNKIISDYKNDISNKKLNSLGIKDTNYLDLKVKEVDKSNSDDLNKYFLASIIPVLLIVTIGLGSVYPAIDITAGEKERGTLETILTVPISKNELFLGKYLAVTFISTLTGILNLLSIFLVYLLQVLQSNDSGIYIDIGIFTFIKMIFLILPVAMFISSMTMSACLFAKSFKDAQNVVTPIYLILMIPTFFSMMPNVELTKVKAFIPILNVCLALKEIIMSDLSINIMVIIFFSNLIYALCGYLFILKLFNTEEVLFSDGKSLKFLVKRNSIKKSDSFKISDIFILASLIMILIIYLGSVFQLKNLFYGIMFTQWILIFMPVILFIWYFKRNFKKVLFLGKFNFKQLIAVLFVGFGGLLAANLQSYFISDIGNQTSKINDALLGLETGGIILAYFALAISPAICEEIFFRGILLSTLLKRFSPAISIFLSSLLFGIFHLDLYRLLPTLILGLIFGYIVYKTKSIFLSIFLHAVNNSLSVTLMVFMDYSSTNTNDSNSYNFIILVGIIIFSLVFGSYLLKSKVKAK